MNIQLLTKLKAVYADRDIHRSPERVEVSHAAATGTHRNKVVPNHTDISAIKRPSNVMKLVIATV